MDFLAHLCYTLFAQGSKEGCRMSKEPIETFEEDGTIYEVYRDDDGSLYSESYEDLYDEMEENPTGEYYNP